MESRQRGQERPAEKLKAPQTYEGTAEGQKPRKRAKRGQSEAERAQPSKQQSRRRAGGSKKAAARPRYALPRPQSGRSLKAGAKAEQQAAPNGARPPLLLPALSELLRSYRPPECCDARAV